MKIRALLGGAVLAAGMVGTASAAVYTGIWDPPYNNAPFTADLGWRGSMTIFVPNGCELPGDGSVDNALDCGGAAAITAASVELYDTDDNAKLATLVFNPGSMGVSTLFYLSGDLNQVDSGLSDGVVALFEPGVDPGTYGFDKGLPFSLKFTSTGPRLGVNCGALLDSCESTNDDNNNRPEFVITRVPEPATLSLAVLAAAGLGWSRRRRAAARKS